MIIHDRDANMFRPHVNLDMKHSLTALSKGNSYETLVISKCSMSYSGELAIWIFLSGISGIHSCTKFANYKSLGL